MIRDISETFAELITGALLGVFITTMFFVFFVKKWDKGGVEQTAEAVPGTFPVILKSGNISVRKFADGPNTCYVSWDGSVGGTSISCVVGEE